MRARRDLARRCAARCLHHTHLRASGIARRIIFDQGEYSGIPFFISYIFVAGIVMTNVVVAILLEKYLQATQEHEKGEKAEQAEADALNLADLAVEAKMEAEDEDDSDGLPVTGGSTAEDLVAVKTKDLVRTHSRMSHNTRLCPYACDARRTPGSITCM